MDVRDFDFFYRKIKDILGVKKDMDVAEKLKISPQAVASAKTKQRIPKTWIDVLVDTFGAKREEFDPTPGIGIPHQDSRLANIVSIPVLGRVPAGTPGQVCEHIEEYISVPGGREDSFALKVRGESMEPTIHHGDYVLFVIDQDARSGDVVVVNDEFGDSMIKRLKEKNGEYYLVSDNPKYPTYRPNGEYRVMGVVVDAWRQVKF